MVNCHQKRLSNPIAATEWSNRPIGPEIMSRKVGKAYGQQNMAIKAQCGSCGTKVNAKDDLAGRRVKCPKCSQPMAIPSARPTRSHAAKGNPAGGAPPAPAPVAAAPAYNPLLDLLDDAGVESVTQGPTCTNCGAEIFSSAVVCVQCGYNVATGEMLETAIYEDDDIDAGMTDAAKILARAEQEIDETPITAEGQDFGDGSESMLIALVAFLIFAALVIVGVGTVLLMDQVSEYISPPMISLSASVLVYSICAVWITIVAFMANPTHGIICVATGTVYCLIFGFLQGKALLMPTLMMLGSIVIGLVCYIYITTPAVDEFGYLLNHGIGQFLG